jgi:hypothetical protein
MHGLGNCSREKYGYDDIHYARLVYIIIQIIWMLGCLTMPLRVLVVLLKNTLSLIKLWSRVGVSCPCISNKD